MNTLAHSIVKIFKGAMRAFQTFPASIGSALLFSVVTIIRIHLDWPQQQSFNFLFNCLHWSFALGAIASLTLITSAKIYFPNQNKAFFSVNLIGVATIAITFLFLFQFGSMNLPNFRYLVMSPLAATRVSVVMLISLILFIILAGQPKDSSNFASSFFMTHKAFFIALIYGIVILIGAFGVAGAVQALLYRGMSSKVYLYIGTLSGFIAFTIFIGYFPDFRLGAADEHRETAQRKPRFIEILFVSILVPILLALTIVLLIWATKTVISGVHVSFLQLAIIAAAYSISGLWLHIMISNYEAGLAKLYRRIYPFSSLVILVFEAWALLKQLLYSGLKITEYTFILIWIVAVLSAILLLTLKTKAHPIIAMVTCLVAVVSVLPIVGYHALPVTAQVVRLEKLLVQEGMLENNHLSPAVTEPESAVRVAITDAVVFLTNAKDTKLPVWLDKDLNKYDVFKNVLGFEQTWPEGDPDLGNVLEGSLGTFLNLSSEPIDIRDFDWVIRPQLEYSKEQKDLTLLGSKGTYHINWTANTGTETPSLMIRLNDQVIIDQNLTDYIDGLVKKYPLSRIGDDIPATNDLILALHSSDLEVLLIFRRIEITVDPSHDEINYWLDLDALYLKENF